MDLKDHIDKIERNESRIILLGISIYMAGLIILIACFLTGILFPLIIALPLLYVGFLMIRVRVLIRDVRDQIRKDS